MRKLTALLLPLLWRWVLRTWLMLLTLQQLHQRMLNR